ncbi:hypothetical protein T484DRAFT_1986479 [Baffinella frigidus]|nr:hypothetical protein T484DRAFT_1986479 [Cryptophyta sp. CCMP2293]
MRGSHSSYQSTVSLHTSSRCFPTHAHSPLPSLTACPVELAPPARSCTHPTTSPAPSRHIEHPET